MIRWISYQNDPHIKGKSELGDWFIRVTNGVVTGIYKMWGEKTKYVPNQEMTLAEAKEEVDVMTQIYKESL